MTAPGSTNVDPVKITLVSEDGKKFTVSKETACQSGALRSMMESVGFDDDAKFAECEIPVHKVQGEVLEHVMEWIARYATVKRGSQVDPRKSRHDSDNKYDGQDQELSAWERRFFSSLSKDALFRLINAANYLDVETLVSAGAGFIAEQIESMSLEETRAYLCIASDFTEEEEAAILAEVGWLNHDKQPASQY